MAISANAMTLADYALISNSPLIQKIVYSLRDNGSVLNDIPWITQKSLIATGLRWTGNLPGVNWAKLNATPTAVKGTPTPFQEAAFMIRNTIEVDHLLVEDQNQIADPRGVQLGAYMRSVAYEFNYRFINNDHTTGDANAIVGLRSRIDNYATYGVNSANKVDAGGAVITTAATAAQANAFLQWLDQLLYAMDALDGTNVVLYMNNDLLIRIPFLIRLLGPGGGFAMTQDAYGRMVPTYKNAVLRDVGLKADQSTKIITSTETSAGVDGSDHHTSIYGVKYGEEFFTGWQFAPLTALDLGQDPVDGVVYRTFVEWAGGLYMANTRSIARLFGLKIS